MNTYNISRAEELGKKYFKVYKNDKKPRYTMANDIYQCQAKYKGWEITEISKEEYLKNK